MHHIGGHSKGLQAVRVKTARGDVVLASDAIHLYEHLEQNKVFPITYNADDAVKGYAKLKQLAPSLKHIVPGHDPQGAGALSVAERRPQGLGGEAGRRTERVDRSLCSRRNGPRQFRNAGFEADLLKVVSQAKGGNGRDLMGKLDGKVAIVTGGARGLGRAYARRLASLGAKIALCDLNLKSYEEFEIEAKDMTGDSTVAEIEAAGGSALGYELDVNDRAAVDAMVADVAKKWGRIDILVCNAGGGRGKPVETKASTLDSSAAASRRRHEPLRHRLFRQRGRPVHEGAEVGPHRHCQLDRQASARQPTAATRITARPRPRSRTTRAIWRRSSDRSASPPTASRLARSRPGAS